MLQDGELGIRLESDPTGPEAEPGSTLEGAKRVPQQSLILSRLDGCYVVHEVGNTSRDRARHEKLREAFEDAAFFGVQKARRRGQPGGWSGPLGLRRCLGRSCGDRTGRGHDAGETGGKPPKNASALFRVRKSTLPFHRDADSNTGSLTRRLGVAPVGPLC